MRKMFWSGLSLMVLFVTAQVAMAEKPVKVILKEGMATKYDPTKKIKIKTKSGKIYKNAEIINATDLGIDIAYKHNDMTILKHLPFSELSPKMQKHFGYNAQKAAKLRKELEEKWQQRQHETVFKPRSHREMRKVINRDDVRKQAGMDNIAKQKRLIDREIENRAHKVMLKIIRVQGPGVVAWADSPDATVTTGHYGKVFIYGLHSPQGNMWVGNVYPTGLQMYGYDCFATNADLAVGLANSHIREILNKSKKRR